MQKVHVFKAAVFFSQYLSMNHFTVSHFTCYLMNESSLLRETILNYCENVSNVSLLQLGLVLEMRLFVNKILQGQNLVDWLEIKGNTYMQPLVSVFISGKQIIKREEEPRLEEKTKGVGERNLKKKSK